MLYECLRPTARVAALRRAMAVSCRDWVPLPATAGYHSDNHSDVWPLSRYVICRLNERTSPFESLHLEQVAGDLLPGASPVTRVSLGYHRMLQRPGGRGTGILLGNPRTRPFFPHSSVTSFFWGAVLEVMNIGPVVLSICRIEAVRIDRSPSTYVCRKCCRSLRSPRPDEVDNR